MRIAVLSGAGISRESGLKTFRDSDGLWGGYRIEDVCTPEALCTKSEQVLDFYNMRRREVLAAEPNPAHFALAELEKEHEVRIVTQNIDDLHERAGSTNVLHIHGEIFKARSIEDFDLVSEIRGDIRLGDLASDGVQLRPHICFFHETPYDWETAIEWTQDAELFVVVGTSLNVYPAAGLVQATSAKKVIVIDPNPPQLPRLKSELLVIEENASTGVFKIKENL